jgi:hypothetical protein
MLTRSVIAPRIEEVVEKGSRVMCLIVGIEEYSEEYSEAVDVYELVAVRSKDGRAELSVDILVAWDGCFLKM